MFRQLITLERKYGIKNPLKEVPGECDALTSWLMLERGRGKFGQEEKIKMAVDYLIEKVGEKTSVGWLEDRLGRANEHAGGEAYSPYIYYDVTFLTQDGALMTLGHSSWEGDGAMIVHDTFRMNEDAAKALMEELFKDVIRAALERLSQGGNCASAEGSAATTRGMGAMVMATSQAR